MTRPRTWRTALAVLPLALALTVPATAQLQYGDLYGVVKDSDGQPLPGATVSLSGVGAPRIAVSEEAGQFRFLNLSPGVYEPMAELSGFSTVEYKEVAVSVGGKTELEITLTAARKANAGS